ncbi:MAG: hypothetical protein AAGL68_01130 [Pseudomonadota bacterium]
MFVDLDFPIARTSRLPETLRPAHAVDRIRFRPRSGPNELDCWIFQPLHRDVAAAPVIAVHGIKRQAREQVELLSERARIQGRVVIAPLFDQARWPRYQQAVVRGRADKALLRLVAELEAEGVLASQRFIFSGFSGGAQFVHRFAMLYPQLVERLIVSSPGWYTMPDDKLYPYGLSAPENRRAVDRLKDNLKRFLQIPITVTIGERDNKIDSNVRTNELLDAQQGETRMERARSWTLDLLQRAQALGVDANVRLVRLARCGHSFKRCVRRGGLDRLILPGRASGRLDNASQQQTCDLAA